MKEIKRKEILLKKLKEVEEAMNFIEENLPSALEDFKRDNIIKNAVYKQAEYLLQGIIDVCSIINSDLNLGIPESEEDFITNLGKAKVVDEKLVKKLKEMKSFRNILVHRYGHIEDEIAFENISKWPEEFNDFIKQIEKILKNQKNIKEEKKK